MKIFICADIEGVCLTNHRDDVLTGESGYAQACELMTREVAAACLGAIEAGANEITVNDAHGGGRNIDVTKLPQNVSVLRGWSGHPYLMVDGIDSSYDAALFVGHHNAAGAEGNPLAHTIHGGSVARMTLNGRLASEFMLFSYACALEGVPTVFLSGDKELIEASADLHPMLVGVPTKDGLGGMTKCYPVEQVLDDIKAGTRKALGQNLKLGRIELPGTFELEVTHKSHLTTCSVQHYPGVERISVNTVRYKSDSYYEILRAIKFILA